MHRLLQEMLKLDARAQAIAARERALVAHVMARAEFLWDGWVQYEHRWELVPSSPAHSKPTSAPELLPRLPGNVRTIQLCARNRL